MAPLFLNSSSIRLPVRLLLRLADDGWCFGVFPSTKYYYVAQYAGIPTYRTIVGSIDLQRRPAMQQNEGRATNGQVHQSKPYVSTWKYPRGSQLEPANNVSRHLPPSAVRPSWPPLDGDANDDLSCWRYYVMVRYNTIPSIDLFLLSREAPTKDTLLHHQQNKLSSFELLSNIPICDNPKHSLPYSA